MNPVPLVVRRLAATLRDELPPELAAAGTPHGDRWAALAKSDAPTIGDGWDDEWCGEQILAWMWQRLAAPGGAVPAWVPERARDAWAVMLSARTPEAAFVAYDVTDRAGVSFAACAARCARWAAADQLAGVWEGVAYSAVKAACAACCAQVDILGSLGEWVPDLPTPAPVLAFWQAADPAGLVDRLLCGPGPLKARE